MNEISKNFEAYAFFGIMVLGLLYIPLVVVVASKAHAASPALPRCDKARTIDYRRCVAAVVTDGNEATVSYTIGWYDRENAVPFWAGDGLPRSQ